MIAFGCSISEGESWMRYAEPGISRVAERDSQILPFASVDSTTRSYNLLLEEAARSPDLEALVLVHPHAEITERDFARKVREQLSDPDVAVLGCAGAREVRSIAWWDGPISCGPVTHRYTEYGGGELPAFSWAPKTAPPADVDAVDEFLLVLSAWAVRSVRFDEALIPEHGYAVDYCLQVRAAERKVQTADIGVIQHRALGLVENLELWTEAHVALANKWGSRLPLGAAGNDPPWEQWARRAEAEYEATRAITYFNRLVLEARVKTLDAELAELTTTGSWRLTEPLRRLNNWRRERANHRSTARPGHVAGRQQSAGR